MKLEYITGSFVAVCFLVAFWFAAAYAFYDKDTDTQKKFTTDGCTLYFDGEWVDCCTAHDRAYWQGGTVANRKQADVVFRECIADVTGERALAVGMYAAVRVGGTPFLNVPWRWGYGWNFGRSYR